MNKTRIGLLIAAALCALPASGWAQKKAGGAAAAKAEAGAAAQGDASGDAAGSGDAAAGGGDAAAGGEAAPGGAAAGQAAGGEAAGGEEEETPGAVPSGEGIGSICEIDPAACPKLDMDKEAKRPLNEPVFAVEQRFIIKRSRFEFEPFWGFTLNDQFVGHPDPGLAINYYISEVLAVGVNGNYYQPFNTDKAFNAQVRRSARVAVPLTEYQWGAALNFLYMPADGKFAGLGDFIFNYDAFIVGGVGALSTRPIPVVDPDNRNFQFEPKLAFNAGIGLRIFFSRWFAAVAEIRDYIFNDQLENLQLAPTDAERQNPATWKGETRLTNNVQAQLGVSIFIPFSFEYRLPK